MKRVTLKSVWMFVLMGILSLGAQADTHSSKFVEGQHYKVIDEPVRTRDSSKVEVVELFWYGCPHCFKLEPALDRWMSKMPDGVDFYRSPAIFSELWKLHAQAYYTGEALKVTEKTHSAMFHALHKEKKKLKDKASIVDFYVSQGVDRAKFEKAFDSFGVRSQLKQAEARALNYGITGVPAVVVNGKYLISTQSAGSDEGVFKVVNFLIEEEKKKMPKS